jgi:hypothetical protein
MHRNNTITVRGICTKGRQNNIISEQQTPSQLKWSDNKVHGLAIMCVPWQQWTDISVWFDDVGISAFHSCVVVDLRQSVSEWRLFLS